MPHDKPDHTSDLVAYKAYPELADALRKRIPAILQKWEHATRELLPPASLLNFTEFRDDVPLTLQRMADALASERPRGLYDLEDTARVHGTSRFDQKFNIRDIITEFRLLRRILLEEVILERGPHFTFGENVELSMASDAAFQETILTFVDHQRDQIQAATDAEAKFLSFMSHDLRNHLNHVTLVVEVIRGRLRGNADFAEDVADLAAVQSSIFETLKGMERLLESERLRKGNVPLNIQPVNLRQLAHHLLQQSAPTANTKNLDLQLDIPETALVNTDPQLLALALQNLIGNAVKYTAHGFVKVHAQPWTQPQPHGWTLSVSDSGPGIPTENIKLLFEAFSRGTTHGQPGVGLGLAIASQATRLLAGKLSVTSTPNQGATFTIHLPHQPPTP